MTRLQSLVALGLALAGIAGTSPAPAQTLDMAQAPQASGTAGAPSRGMTMAQVERQFGAPAERAAAVGRPPITRWVYADKVVFFEYDHVVHTVVVRQ